MKKAQYAILSFNTVMLAVYFYLVDIDSHKLRIVITLLLVFCAIGFAALRYSGKLAKVFQNFHLLLFGAVISVCALETTKLCPKLIPAQIRNYLEEKNIRQIRINSVEYLDRSPFGKFKANTTIVSQGDRGTDKQFVYEWKTDGLGFKNPKEMLEKGNIEIVAVGDSFTEGMGVAICDTWPSILTKEGYATYNLGVQGYAPIQLEGSFRLYGYRLKPRYVIIGYCAGTYIREKMFLDEKRAVKEHRLEGGINSSASASNKEIRRRSKYVAIALFSWLRNDYRNMLNRLLYALKYSKYRRAPGDKRLYEKYAPEIIETEKKETDPSDVEDSLEYKKALNAFLNIKKMADKIQAKVFFVYLPQRGDIYYEKLTGKKLPKRSFVLIESGLLRKFCDKEGIIFIDPSKRIIYYVNNLKNGELMSSYPYLEIDGHMSPCGNRLVAKEILTYLDSSAKPIK